MRLIFLDTEFSALPNSDPLVGYLPKPKLISLGLVTENGESFYAESTDFTVRFCSEFVRHNVLPILTGPRLQPLELGAALNRFLSAQPPNSQIACDYYLDFELLLHALNWKLPPNILTDHSNLAWLGDDDGAIAASERFFSQGRARHHALADAEALRLSWLATRLDFVGDEK